MAFFRANPDEELGLDDISGKFDCTRGNIHTLLAEPLRLGILARIKNADGDYIYKRGSNLLTTVPDAPPAAQRLKRSNNTTVELPDLDAVVIEENVPIPSLRGTPKRDWTPLLRKLKKDQSFALPITARHTLSQAITDLHKASAGRFTMRTFKDTAQLRVWRTA
jgi:hypothetical protein